MGKKVKWFDTVQKILSSSEPDPVPAETETKVAKSKDKLSFKKLWHFTKSSNSASTSAAAGARQQQPPPPSPSPLDQRQGQEIVVRKAQSLDVRIEQVDHVCPTEEVAAQAVAETVACPTDASQEQEDRICPAEAVAGAGDAEAAAVEDTRPTDSTPSARPARSNEDIAATRIQATCRGYLARRAHRERARVRLMSLVGGHTVKRQTGEALYCMQTMTRVQTQIYARRLKTEEDKKALKSQIKMKQSLDKAESKEQMEAVFTIKQEAASRRQRALAYAFSQQWRNRNPSSARTAPPPMFMDQGNPNWGWTWTERWMAAARPWETQTAAPGNDRATAKTAGARPRVTTLSVQPPTTPGGRSFRPPNWLSLPSPSTPLPLSPSAFGRTRSGTITGAPSVLQRTKSLQLDRRPQERAVSSSRGAVPAESPRRRGSPLRSPGSGGLQRTTSAQPERRPRSSQERTPSSPRRAGANAALLRTTSLRCETPRRLRLGGGAPSASAAENAGAPVTPSYMQPTTSVRAKARCASPSASSSPNKADGPEKSPAPLLGASPSSAKKRLSLVVADKASMSSPSMAKAERAKRHSQPPSPRTQLT